MERSSRIERDKFNYHNSNPISYHLDKVSWTVFGSLTFRVVPPDYVQRKCIFEFVRRTLKRFSTSQDLNWSTEWIFRQEFGEKNGRCHWHFLMVLDKPHPNDISRNNIIKSIWRWDVSSRQVGRYNDEANKHNSDLRRELRYKSPEERESQYAERARLHIRNDYSAAGFADVRSFIPNHGGCEYVMKGDDWNISGANAYELNKFNELDNTNLLMSHKLLMKLFKSTCGRSIKYKAMADFRQGLVDRTSTSSNGPQGEYQRTPDASSQLWNPTQDFRPSVHRSEMRSVV